ncbi:AAA domain-containing protein [uncultured Polaribacter sp.]|uniref:DEAD/DEAH box helicase n=1 Tax=uncultured Polaribacter sp. TaxID=174711 RepID=UPI002615F5A7|nr:AAA domain-containing protein [uncultured Polaribacter sp.]
MNNVKNWLHYYKNSLTDSENLAVDISRIKNLFHQNYCDLGAGTINPKNAAEMLDFEEKRINRLKGITNKEHVNWYTIFDAEIIIAPFQLDVISGNQDSKHKSIFPFWITARINRSGQLTAPKEIFPLFVRDYLDPKADVGNDFIFSSTETIAEAREIENPEVEEEVLPWEIYWEYINMIFSEVTYHAIPSYKAEGFTTNHKVTYFARSSKISAAKSILFLYENLLNETEELPLISKLIDPNLRQKREPITDSGFLDYNHLHLGQMSNEFPLSISQRKTLLSYFTAEENAITAVNGPPGTGKTTLLQSLVATEVVRAAIEGDEAPVILACSTNNQAVTNIIDSFINSKSTLGDLAERWIPGFNGYATYLPSNSKSEKKLKNINYLKGNMFGNEGTLCDLENEKYLEDAKHFYFSKYTEYFNVELNSLEDACLHLQEEITILQDNLIDGVRISQNYLKSIKSVNALLLNKKDYIQKNTIQISNLQKWRTILNALKSSSDERNFLEDVKQYFETNSKDENSVKIFKIDEEVLKKTDTTLIFIKKCIADINLALSSNLKLKNWKFKNNITGYPFVSEEQMWEFEYEKMESEDKSHRFFYDEIDLNIRHKAFLLAIHYWEARWIIETEDALINETEKGTGERVVAAKWKRRAMLTPCFVATLYMAPSHFLFSQFQGENENGKPLFEYLPLFNFLDLLIIDEAGQVTPEVSIPIFSLAKKAIVVGDLKQIEPIWSIPPKIDSGNLLNQNIVSDRNDYNHLKEIGFLASNGSIMKMAQNACEYATPLISKKENGLLLLEHRRCNDEIIGFCNELAYDGILKPMKGKASEDQVFPSMMAYHIEGLSERKFSSRHNKNEVKSIIMWLNRHKADIQKAYNVESIEEVLGIITPFASQKTELSKALIDSGFKVNDIKLGTVHALQGAERSIVLFSSVYSIEDEGVLFFDRDNKPNMLNVAVSRAKDSFILFGDTRIFDETKDVPSGILKKHLQIEELPN